MKNIVNKSLSFQKVQIISKGKIFALALIIALVLTVAPLIIVPTAHATDLPSPAPDFSMTGYPDGNIFNLSGFIKGKVSLLEFFQDECPYCRNESKELTAVKDHYGNSVPMVSVNMQDKEWPLDSGANNFTWYNSTYGPVTWRVALDTFNNVNGTGWGKYNGNFGYSGTPQIYIIDKNGNLTYVDQSNDGLGFVLNSTMITQINTLLYKLTVASAYDSPSPGVGDTLYNNGSSVNCSITSPVTVGSTVWVCTGWTGTGDVPNGTNTLGYSNWVAFTITQNTSITWNWASYTNIDNLTAYNMMTNGTFPDLAFLDVRDANEGPGLGFEQGHIYGAIWMSWNLQALQTNVSQLSGRENENLIVYCRSGGRSAKAAPFLVAHGFNKVYDMRGAMPSWMNQGYPYVNASAHLVVRGMDDSIYYRALNATDWQWQNWNVLPGSTVDSPAAAMLWGNVTRGNDTMHFVVRGSDGTSLWYGYISMNLNATDKTFHGWTLLDGSTPSAPTLASNGTALCLVVRGEDERIYYRCYNGSWGSWYAIPTGATPDAPAAAMLGDNLHIVVRGMDNSSLWDITVACNGTVVRDWNLLSGATPSRPVLASAQDLNKLYLIVRGMDNVTYYMNYTGLTDSWGGWSAFPGATDNGPAATAAGNELYTVVQGMDGSTLWLGYCDEGTNTFSGWASLSGATLSPPTLTG